MVSDDRFGDRDHGAVEFKNTSDSWKTASKASTLDMLDMRGPGYSGSW